MAGGAFPLRSRGKWQHSHQTQKNQCLQEWPLPMFKSCGKRRFIPESPIDPSRQSFSRVGHSKKLCLVSSSYDVVISSQKNTISCGSRGSLEKFIVHNLFKRHFSDRNWVILLRQKRGENFSLLPSYEILSSRNYL